MFVVTVIPITRARFKEHLSFFSKRALPEGAIIDVPVRGKPTPALITNVADVREEKQKLRTSAYSLKKIAPKNARRIFPENTVCALKETARWHVAPVGAVLARFLPSAILSASLPAGNGRAADNDNLGKTTVDVLALQAEYNERVHRYRSLAREALARGQSLLIVTPTVAEAEALYDALHRGIEDRALILTGSETKKHIRDAWKRAAVDPEALVIIATYPFLAIPRAGLDAIIVERESARGYVSREQGAIDARRAAEYVARRNGARIIFADFPVRIETRARLATGELEELTRLQASVQRGASVRLIDARTKKDAPPRPQAKKRHFSVFTGAAKNAIQEALSRGSHVFLHAARRGLAPLTVCNDCGAPVTDPSTGAPMTLQKTESGNVFLSFRSGAVLPANISCKACGSWNLMSLGIGVERVIEEAERLFKDALVFSLTAESAPTHAKAKRIRERFYDAPGAILVGTDRALPYLSRPVELSVVMSIDSLLSMPLWRADEYALQTMFYLKDRTKTLMLVQTRQPDNHVMAAIASGNPTEFVRDEMKERKRFGYPPYVTFIGLSWIGTERATQKTADAVKAALAEHDVVGPLPARQVGRNRFQARAVVRVGKDEWPDERLIGVLKTLPRDIAVTVDPDEIV